MSWRYEKVNNHSRLGGISVGVQGLVNDLLTRVKDIYRKLLLKLFPQPSIPEPPPPSVEAKPKANSSYGNPKALLLKRARTVKKGSKGKK
jgi:hypothetical protein